MDYPIHNNKRMKCNDFTLAWWFYLLQNLLLMANPNSPMSFNMLGLGFIL